MGEPAQPGEDQLTTIVVEGPPAGTTDNNVLDDYREKFERFKNDMADLFKRNPAMKLRLRSILYVPKGKDDG